MGRHAAGLPDDAAERARAAAPTGSEQTGDAPTGDAPQGGAPTGDAPQGGAPTGGEPIASHGRSWLRDGLVLAAVAGLTVGLVLAWAIGTWWVAVLGGLGAAAVVLAASWVARSVPGPDVPPGGAPKVDR